jgi:hypothetical protein
VARSLDRGCLGCGRARRGADSRSEDWGRAPPLRCPAGREGRLACKTYRAPEGPGAIYLCQHAVRSKATLRRVGMRSRCVNEGRRSEQFPNTGAATRGQPRLRDPHRLQGKPAGRDSAARPDPGCGPGGRRFESVADSSARSHENRAEQMRRGQAERLLFVALCESGLRVAETCGSRPKHASRRVDRDARSHARSEASHQLLLCADPRAAMTLR